MTYKKVQAQPRPKTVQGRGASDSKYRLLEGQAPVNTEEIFAGRLTKSNEQLDRDTANHGGIRLTEPIKICSIAWTYDQSDSL
jgi:hypothetical protein